MVLQHFHSAIELSPAELIFPRSDNPQNYAVKFVYKKQRLTQILAGPALKPEDISTLQGVVEAELKTPAPVKFGAEVLFADMPLDGSFRYQNLFQILPLPPEAPRPHTFGFDHPFLLQFSFRPSTLTMLRSSRRIAQAHKLQLLLTGILEGRVRGLGVYVQHHWVVPSNQPPEHFTSAYYQQMYEFPGLGQLRESDEFSPNEGAPPLTTVDPQEYYTRTSILGERSLQIPSNLAALVDRFFSLLADDQDRFLRACFWFNHANSVQNQSRSAAFMALISSLEALMVDEKPISQCSSCGRPVRKGSIRSLSELLDQFAPASPGFQAARSKLYYEFRSGLSHGGNLSYSDRQSFLGGLTRESSEERNRLTEVWQLVKIVLVNWLHSRSPLLVTAYPG